MQNRLTPAQALEKIKHFCAYQERSHQEVKDKLYKFGLYTDDVDSILSTLIEENYLNEERYARHFVRGKFRMKKWGKIKIVYALKQNRVSFYNINVGLKEIEEEQYKEVLYELTSHKWEELKEEQYLNRQAKVIRYMQQKGYELNLVMDCLKNIRS